MNETKIDLLKDLLLDENSVFENLEILVKGDSKYLRDLRINVKNALNTDSLSQKEAYLIALAIAVNEKNKVLIESFRKKALENQANDAEIAEIYSCASLLSVNNVFYRFRHFAQKESYNNMAAGIKMNIMMSPVLGKAFFELVSLVVSAVNGCQACVKSHEESLVKLNVPEQKIFDAVKLGAVIRGLSAMI